ncbi:hypothetical protein CXF68_01735 [Tenacibaculum sp. Bg11-29]|uniref:hypothetical protein n=1 Tax=Tenacibaculum sp. Bg11-29 TaxID=2058306 RepID=UPI000C33E0E9|nr:hypothetical protein [Tenacibaculum sp. Bg11-29]PKH49485.1 hypothetical protein CXF68_01735 [Tenacibaculum sp. Bg11-29]
MATLKEYLGTIVADINHARSIADIESARMAKQYAADDILQYYSIPRMKMQDVELTIPVGISKSKEKTTIDYEPIDNNSFYSKTYSSLKNVYKTTSFDTYHSKQLSSAIKHEIQSLEKVLKLRADQKSSLKEFCNRVAEIATKIINTPIKESKSYIKQIPEPSYISTYLVDQLQNEITLPKKHIEDTEVITESDKLRELNPNSIIQIKMKIIEQGMEWHKMEDSNGEMVSKLTVE